MCTKLKKLTGLLNTGEENLNPTQPREFWCQGFSLIETLVAITILMLVIVAPMTITSQTAKSSSFSSEQVSAFFLAQEGVELVQKARDDLQVRHFLDVGDSNYLATPWAIFKNDTSGPLAGCFTNPCGIEIEDHQTNSTNDIANSVSCSAANIGNCKLYRTTSNQRSRFTHVASGNEETPYTRTITLERIGTGDEVKITSRVTWRTGTLKDDQVVEVQGRVFNIYGN
jgi:prepilin-type N-terminal cleavage/methylation domain-containing protein